MQTRNSKSLPIGLAVAAVAAVLFVDATAMAAEGERVRRTRDAVASTPATSTPAPAPSAGAGASTGEKICYSTTTLPAVAPTPVAAPEPTAAPTDGRVRRTRGAVTPAPTPIAPADPIVVTVVVPCETPGPVVGNPTDPVGGNPTGPIVGNPTDPVGGNPPYTPGLLGDTGSPGTGGFGEIPSDPVRIAQVPEPSMLALLGIGAVGLLAAARRRRS